MPLNGAGLAAKPAGTTAVSNTTIESSKFNSVIDDIYNIFNTARPVVYGGTGGTSVITGWDGLAAAGTDVASSGTINLTTATGPLIDLTGTTAVSTVTLAEGAVRLVRATGVLRLNASASLIVNGSTTQSYTTTAKDLLLFRGYGSSVVNVWTINTPPYGLAPYPSGHLYGLTLSNGTDATNDLNIAVGTARDGADSANIDLTTAMGKQLDTAWAVGGTTGTPLGMLATGVAVTNTTYYIFAIKRPDTGVVDIAADTSSTGANIAANTNAAYTITRAVGEVTRTGGVNGTPIYYGNTPLTLGATQTLSSTSTDFNGVIPAWAKRIRISWKGLSTNGTSVPIIQIGDSGGIETSGYNGSSGTVAGAAAAAAQSTTGFGLAHAWGAANVASGSMTLELHDATTFTWTATGMHGLSNAAQLFLYGYDKSLTGTLDRVRFTMTNGTDTFDAGTASIAWE